MGCVPECSTAHEAGKRTLSYFTAADLIFNKEIKSTNVNTNRTLIVLSRSSPVQLNVIKCLLSRVLMHFKICSRAPQFCMRFFFIVLYASYVFIVVTTFYAAHLSLQPPKAIMFMSSCLTSRWSAITACANILKQLFVMPCELF